MDVLVIGAGMMGRAIAFDLARHSDFTRILLVDSNKTTLETARAFLQNAPVDYKNLDVTNRQQINKAIGNVDVAISAVPYFFNVTLATAAIQASTHFIDLGGNNEVVAAERALAADARRHHVTVIPDCGLAPGLVSVITRDIVETLDTVKSVKLRVGGLPVHPKPPLNYQLVFSPDGLINEYVEDAMILDHGKVRKKPSMTELETLRFPAPFGAMEAFLTSGGCSTLPYTYQHKIHYLDYKTIRYPGHCAKIKAILDLGFADQQPLPVGTAMIRPRDILTALLKYHLPSEGEDVVLLKVTGAGTKDGSPVCLEYRLIDYCDTRNGVSAMMRTTGYPVSITSQFIASGLIPTPGVFCPEEIIPYAPMVTELKKRGVILKRVIRQGG